MESGVLAFCAFLRTELAPAASVQHSQHPLAFVLFQEGVERVEPRWLTMGPPKWWCTEFVESRKVGMRGGNSGPPRKWEALQPWGLGLSHP